MKKWRNIILVVYLISFAVLFWNLFSTHVLNEKAGGLYSSGTAWIDLPGHLALSMNIAEHGLMSTIANNPLYSGTTVSYPFIPDAISGAVIAIGVSPRMAFIWQDLLLVLVIVYGIFFLCYRVTRSFAAALMGPLIFFFSGTLLSVPNVFKDMMKSGKGLAYLLHPAVNYSFMKGEGIRIANITYDFILSQRAFVFGLAIGVFALYFLWQYWNSKHEKDLLYASLLICALPLIHTHSLITLCVICFFLFCGEIAPSLWKKDMPGFDSIVRRWTLCFGLPVLILALPQLIFIYPHDRSSFIQLGFFASDLGNPIIFWLKNLFPHLIVFILAYALAPKKLKTFFNAFIGLFFIFNFVIFQPYPLDNLKFFVWFFFGGAVLVCSMFSKILNNRKRWEAWSVIVFLMICMTATGILCMRFELESSYPIFSRSDMALADFIKKSTAKSSVFLTSTRNNNPVNSLAGRAVLEAYPSVLQSYGIEFRGRRMEMSEIYSGKAGSEKILSKYDVSYIVVDDNVLKEFSPDLAKLRSVSKLIFTSGSTTLYRVSSVSPPTR